ncbi:MAG: Uma2 family endonuclease [Chloroflexota bacterium]|nr:Uma2 family endonuclease [Chloroflexota bacterium]
MVQVPTAAPPAHEQRISLSYPEWLAWAGGGQQSEWVDGEAIVFVPPSVLHARILAFLSGVLGWYVEAFGLGEVLQAPVELRLRPGRLSREPDLLFVAERHRDRIGARRIEGAADLVVEVVSEHSESRDRVEKLGEYQAASIPEYWLFDPCPDQRRSDFFQLVDGVYQPVGLDADGRYHSAVVPGFWLRPDWLWQEPLPTRRACLLEIAPETLVVPSSGKATP